MLGVEGFGQYGFAVALSAYFSVVAECGLFQYQITSFPLIRNTGDAPILLGKSIMLRLVLGLVTSVVFIIIGQLSNKPVDVKIFIVLLAASLLLNNIAGAFSSVLYGYEKFGLFGLLSSGTQLLVSTLMFLALIMGRGLVGIGVAIFITTLITTTIIVVIVSLKYCRPKLSKINGLFDILLKSLPVGVMTILVVLYYRANFAILSFFKGDTVLGYYNAAFAIVSGITILTTTFGSTILPRLSWLLAYNRDGLISLYNRSFRYLMFAGVGIAVGGLALAKPLMEFLYSSAYRPAATELSILIWVAALTFTNPLQSSLLVARKIKQHLIIMASLAAICGITIGIILIPRYSLVGAGIALLTSELISWIYAFILNREYLSLDSLLSIFWKAMAASGVMFLVLKLADGVNVICLLFLGAGVYIITLFIVRGFNVDDIGVIARTIGLSRQPVDTK
jgi:O-antigen/teichoic acid export membrane protein